jgi:diguanylate cyclase
MDSDRTGTLGDQSAHAQLAHAATHDHLTDLSNRAFTLQQLSALLAGSAGDTQVAVLFVDLDRFKLVNDSLGHHAGDELLRQFAARLREIVRAGDVLGRFGGDEFVVACRLRADADARSFGQRIVDRTSEPFAIDGRDVIATASIGIAVSNEHERDPERLLQDADTALFQAKRRGRGRVEVFTMDLRRRMLDRVELETELRAALAAHKLRVAYQPQVDLHSGLLVGVEALVRWDHPRRGAVPPLEFIEVAEEAGLIGELGRFVLETACAQLVDWRRRSSFAPPVVTVNVSPFELLQDGFAAGVAGVLARSGLDARSLCLEVTESALMGWSEGLAALAEVRELGCYIGIDDFGTGYSSFGRLRDLPVDVLKIDRSFVAGLGADPDDGAIVASIISMALTMGLHVVAEGVEQPCQAEALTRLGCRVAQGYLFARPQGPDAILTYGRRRLWRPLTGEDAAADRGIGSMVPSRSTRRGHLRFIHEFLDQIGVPMTPSASAETS